MQPQEETILDSPRLECQKAPGAASIQEFHRTPEKEARPEAHLANTFCQLKANNINL